MKRAIFSTKLCSILLAAAILLTTLASGFLFVKADPQFILLIDDENNQSMWPASVSDEQAKVGSKSLKSTTGVGDADSWILRGGFPSAKNISVLTQNGTAGAVRFWFFIADISTLPNWNGGGGDTRRCQFQLGEDWDKNVYAWNNWQTQVTKNGWNEIVLPFENAGKIGNPNPLNITYMNIKTFNDKYVTTIFIDDVQVSENAQMPEPEEPSDPENDLIVVDDESGEFIPPSAISTEQVKIGNKSLKASTGGGSYFFVQGALPRALDIRTVTQNGALGALRFWVYVDDISTLSNWNDGGPDPTISQVQLGAGWDNKVYVWNNWQAQITKNGWSEIVLPFSGAGKVGAPTPQNITYLHIKNFNTTYTATIYVDDIRISQDTTTSEGGNIDPTPVIDPNMILSNEDSEWGGFCAVISDEKAKSGKYSYKSTPGYGDHDGWMIRTGLTRPLNMSALTQNGTKGAVRFWIYVDSKNDVMLNWNGSQLQLGADWDINAYVWNNWDVQITKGGWNEIILPFAQSGKIGTPNPAKITYINIRMNNTTYKTTLYLDDIRVSADASRPSEIIIDKDLILSDENGESGGFCAGITDEKAKIGSLSYKATPGYGDHENWMIRTDGGLARTLNMSATTQNGTKGAVRFWIYVDSKNDVMLNWNGSQLQLGEYWDINSYVWNNWDSQIASDGWNEIVLPFEKAGKVGTPNPANITYINIRMNNVTYKTTVYLDDIRVSGNASRPVEKVIDPNIIISDEDGESAGFCAVISDEKAKVGSFSYKATPGYADHDSFMVRTDGGLARTLNMSAVTKNGTAGAVRFWVYVDSKNDVMLNWNGSQLQLGEYWDVNSYVWNNWDNQISQNGWNEIILPFEKAGKVGTPNPSSIRYINIRMNNVAFKTTVYLDDIRVSENASAPNKKKIDPNIILSDEDGESPGFCAVITDEKAKVGSFSYKATPGYGDHDSFMIRTDGGLARTLDISNSTKNGTQGSVSFWIYVDRKKDVVDNWGGSQLQLGAGWDKDSYVWNSWDAQIKQDGWNKIILEFSVSGAIGSPNPKKITYMLIKMYNIAFKTTVYLDDIRISNETLKINDTPTISGAKMFQPFESMGGLNIEAGFVKKIWLDSDIKTQGDTSLAFVSHTGSFALQYRPAAPADATGYNCLEFDLYVPKSDIFEFANHSLELTSSGKMDVNEMSWSFSDLQLDEGLNHISLSFERAAFTRDWKFERDIDLSAINYMRFYAEGAEIYSGIDLTWHIDNMVFTKNGLPPLADQKYDTVNDTGLDVFLTAAKDVLPNYGLFSVNKPGTEVLSQAFQEIFKKDDSTLVLALSFQKDNMEYFFKDTVNVSLRQSDSLKLEKDFYIYRADINGTVRQVKSYTVSGGVITWKENKMLSTYILSNTQLDEKTLQDAADYDKNKETDSNLTIIIVIIASALIVLGGGAAIAVILIKKRAR